jgi:hypothetical protein
MLKVKESLLIVLMVSSLLAVPVFAGTTGNGAQSGAHFNLNIIGVPKAKSVDPADYANMGHRIFVPLIGPSRISLVPGPDFRVIDYDGTDGSAKLQLVDPFPEGVVGDTAVYKIYVRALGKPGGTAIITSGFTDENGADWYSLETVTVTRTKGRTLFSDKTLELTTIYVDITDDGIDNPIRYRLFDNALWDYFWQYDNNGLKLCQLRFYMITG